MTLQPRDINYGGHLGNDALVSLLGTARAHMFRTMGVNETNLGDGHTGIIMTDLTVEYKAEAFMFDQLLIDTHIGELARLGFRLFQRITRENRIIALAETGLLAFDYRSRKVAPVPEVLIESLRTKAIGP
jgi:acyl-CoA thioesterase FadM